MFLTPWLSSIGFLPLMASGKPIATVSNFDGKFRWIKMPVNAVKPARKGDAILISLSFPKGAILKRDKNGYAWFTFIVADQGPDWKWHQTTKAGGISVERGSLQKGEYTVVVPSAGIPSSVLRSPSQSISVGPAISGLARPISFSIKSIQLR